MYETLKPGTTHGDMAIVAALEKVEKRLEALTEATLANTNLLMRLYDVESAILAGINPEETSNIFDAHAEGKHFNPPLFIPVIEEKKPVDKGGIDR